MTRSRRPDIESITMLTKTILAAEGQCFYETPKSFELWQEGPMPCLLRRFNRKNVYWIGTRDLTTPAPWQATETYWKPASLGGRFASAVLGPEGVTVANAYGKTPEEALGNAGLTAAAPKLREVLEKAKGCFGGHNLLSTATDEERRDALKRLLDWWNQEAVPTLEATEWRPGREAQEPGAMVDPEDPRDEGPTL